LLEGLQWYTSGLSDPRSSLHKEANRDFANARRKAFLRRVVAFLRRDPRWRTVCARFACRCRRPVRHHTPTPREPIVGLHKARIATDRVATHDKHARQTREDWPEAMWTLGLQRNSEA
jgi:hypothetical protein